MRPGHLVQFGFIDDLDGDLLAGEDVSRQLHHGEVTAAERLLQVVEAGDLTAPTAPSGQRRRGANPAVHITAATLTTWKQKERMLG